MKSEQVIKINNIPSKNIPKSLRIPPSNNWSPNQLNSNKVLLNSENQEPSSPLLKSQNAIDIKDYNSTKQDTYSSYHA